MCDNPPLFGVFNRENRSCNDSHRELLDLSLECDAQSEIPMIAGMPRYAWTIASEPHRHRHVALTRRYRCANSLRASIRPSCFAFLAYKFDISTSDPRTL
jgi:hypothetical protein